MNNVLLSIIVITYNQEKYIRDTLESILSQKHNYSYEIIIGEDCSPDNTKEIIKEYVQKYGDIIKPLYNKTNLGVIKNYFNVYKNCRGKYIMECAGDDWWLPGKIQKQIELMEKDPDIGMCYGKAICHDQDNNRLDDYVGDPCDNFEDLIKNNYIPACTVCFKKSLFDQYLKEINPESKPWRMEDYPTWLWMIKNTKIKYLNDELAAYRILQESVSRTKNIEKQVLFESSTWEIRKFFADKYDLEIESFDIEEFKTNKIFESIIENYDKELAIEFRKRIKINSIKNLIKYTFASSKLSLYIYKLVFIKK